MIGAGPVGSAIALELVGRGFEVHQISAQWPGEGITGDYAAGIGCVFKPSSAAVGAWVLDSYARWMAQARDMNCPAVQLTRVSAVVPSGSIDPVWKDRVEDFRRDSDTRLSYLTYSFDPVQLGQWRTASFVAGGGVTVRRPLTPTEVSHLRQRRTIEGFSHTVVTMGLNLRAVFPELMLYPIRGVLVHFRDGLDGDNSFIDENAVSYAVTRPNGCVIGGTFDEYVETCSVDEQQSLGEQLVIDANRRFGLTLDFTQRTRITVGYRPGCAVAPGMDVGDEVSIVNGLGGQGWVTGHALATDIADRIQKRLPSASAR